MTRPRNKLVHHGCYGCGHEWKGYSENPHRCPACKSYRWKEPPTKSTVIDGRHVEFERLPYGKQVFLVYEKAANQGGGTRGKVECLIGACRDLKQVKTLTPAIISVNYHFKDDDEASGEAGL